MTGGPGRMTPEEKLLHIIEKPHDINGLSLGKKKKLSMRNPARRPVFSMPDLSRITLKAVNKALIWAAALSAAVIAVYFVGEERAMGARFAGLEEAVRKEGFNIAAQEELIPKLMDYLAQSQANNPFDVLPSVTAPKGALRGAKEEKKTPLKLVGIIWADTPQAMIEDSQTNQNYLVSRGQKVDRYTVSEITEEEVKLTSKDGDQTLR